MRWIKDLEKARWYIWLSYLGWFLYWFLSIIAFKPRSYLGRKMTMEWGKQIAIFFLIAVVPVFILGKYLLPSMDRWMAKVIEVAVWYISGVYFAFRMSRWRAQHVGNLTSIDMKSDE